MVSGRVIRKPLSEKMFETLTDLIFAVDSLSVLRAGEASIFCGFLARGLVAYGI